MADKQAVRSSIAALGEILKTLRATEPSARTASWRLQREVLIAEMHQLLSTSFGAGSRLSQLLDETVKADALPGPPRDDSSAGKPPVPTLAALETSPSAESLLDAAMEVLRSVDRWNEARVDDDATKGLEEDINRVLSRRIWKHPVVVLAIALLTVAVGFGVLGAVRVGQMEFKVLEAGEKATDKIERQARAASVEADRLSNQLAQTRKDADSLHGAVVAARHRIDEAVAAAAASATAAQAVKIQEGAASAVRALSAALAAAVQRIDDAGKPADAVARDAAKLDRQLATTRADAESLSETVTTARRRLDESVASAGALLTASHAAKIQEAAASAITAVQKAKSTGVQQIEEAARPVEIAEAQTRAANAIQTAASSAAATIGPKVHEHLANAKVLVAPAFDAALVQDAKRLKLLEDDVQVLERRLRATDSQLAVANAAFRALQSPESAWIDDLADHFNVAVQMVWTGPAQG